jgi:hypothetical protein
MEPERPIEKLLRAFAKKRRDQAEDAWELPGPARERLRQEIARRSPRKSGGGFFSNLLIALRPGMAFALCFLALLGVGGWLLIPAWDRKKPATLASANSQLEKTAPLQQNAAALRPAASPAPTAPARQPELRVVRNASGAVASDKGNPVFKTQGTAVDSLATAGSLNRNAPPPAFPPAPPVESVGPRPAPTRVPREPDARQNFAMESAPASLNASDAISISGMKDGPTAVGVVASQRFYRLDVPVNRRRGKAPGNVPAPVLASFRMEQNGADVRVVDADGSIYTGAVRIAPDEKVPALALPPGLQNAPVTADAAKTRTPLPASQNYFFRVSGTNRNLKQNIVFSGSLIPLTNGLSSRTNAGGFGGAAGARRIPIEPPAPSLLSNSRISGTAVIGNQKKIEVNAAPTP